MRCFIAIDALLRERVVPEFYWSTVGKRIDKRLEIVIRPSKIYKEDLTFDKAVKMFVETIQCHENRFLYFSMKSTRFGIDDISARLLTERCVRRDQGFAFFIDVSRRN